MTPAQLQQMDDRHERLQLQVLLQAAEISALLALLHRQSLVVRALQDPAGPVENLELAFVSMRDAQIKRTLRQLEKTDPGRAARYAELLETPGLHLPVTSWGD